MRQTIEIRKMTIDDLHHVYMMGNKNTHENCIKWNENNLAEVLSENLEVSFVAASKKKVAAFIICTILNKTTLKVTWFGYNEEALKYTKTDILIKKLKSELSALGIEKVKIAIDKNNVDLIHFLNKFGFTDVNHVLTMEANLPINNDIMA